MYKLLWVDDPASIKTLSILNKPLDNDVKQVIIILHPGVQREGSISLASRRPISLSWQLNWLLSDICLISDPWL